MAANWDKEAKTFVVPEGRTGNKRNVLGGLFGRIRTVDKRAGAATDHRYVFFGLWSKDDTYSFVQTSEQGAVFRRTHKTSFNGFRTKDTEYYPDRGKRSENRRYLGGLFTSGVGYDTDGEIISRSDGDFMGKTTWSKSRDSRTQTFEQDDLFGWYGRKQESLALPGDNAVKWRTVERRIGSYEMKIQTSKDGALETRTHGFGRVLGKNWLFSRTSVYNFETGIKTTKYRGLFGFRDRGGDGKDRPISPKEMQKHQERMAQKEKAANAWEKHALGLSDTASVTAEAADHSSMFEQKLHGLESGRGGNSKDSLDAWLDREVEEHKETLSGKGRTDSVRRRVSFSKELDPVRAGESASHLGLETPEASSSVPRRPLIEYNGVLLPPDTPRHLLPGKGTAKRTTLGPERKTTHLSTSEKTGAADLSDSDSGPDVSTKGAPVRKPLASKERHPSDKDLAGIVAEAPPARGGKVTGLKNTSWKTGLADLSDDNDSASEVSAKEPRRGTPSPTREERPSGKNLAGIVESTLERTGKPAATLRNSSWNTGAADLPDSDDDRVRSRELYQKPKRQYDDRSSDRDRGSMSSLDFG